MSLQTHLHSACERVERERETVSEKQTALGTFADEVEATSTVAPQQKQTRQTVTGNLVSGSTRPGTDPRETVLSAFGETVESHVDGGETSTLSAIQSELGDSVALALAPTTQSAFTPTLQSQLLSAIERRRQELTVTETAMDRERDHLEGVTATVEDVTDWVVTADETPLSELGFEQLRQRHERLDEWQATIEACIADRQQFLQSTTSEGGEVGVGHRTLAASLYDDFPVDYPALSTATRLLDIVENCQDAVRSHLVWRG